VSQQSQMTWKSIYNIDNIYRKYRLFLPKKILFHNNNNNNNNELNEKFLNKIDLNINNNNNQIVIYY
jgi:hypothetical protein